MIENCHQNGCREQVPQLNKGRVLTGSHRTSSSVAQSRREQDGMPLLPLLFSVGLKVLARAVRQEEEVKRIRIGKEEAQRSLLADGILENPKDHQKTVITNKFREVQDRQSIYRSRLLYVTNNTLSERKIKKAVPVTTHRKEQTMENPL